MICVGNTFTLYASFDAAYCMLFGCTYFFTLLYFYLLVLGVNEQRITRVGFKTMTSRNVPAL